MYMWWPRILPFVGTTWVRCDRHGKRSASVKSYEARALIVAWLNYAVVLWQGKQEVL